jgi:hypothetical protein
VPIAKGIKQCSYVRLDGRRCGSPALLTDDRCFHHHRSRKPDPIELTPHLRELADIFADPLFHQHLEMLSERCVSGAVTMQELEDTISTLIGFNLRKMGQSSAACNASVSPCLRGEEKTQPAFTGANL